MSANQNEFCIALVEANKSRARVYLQFYRAIERRFGQAVAIEICKEAIYNWGRELGAGLQAHVADDFDGLASSFAFAPYGGAMFQPRIDRCDEEGLDVQFEACPLKTAWLDSRMLESEVALFWEMASAADYGTLEAAGFAVSIETWKPGKNGCCTQNSAAIGGSTRCQLCITTILRVRIDLPPPCSPSLRAGIRGAQDRAEKPPRAAGSIIPSSAAI